MPLSSGNLDIQIAFSRCSFVIAEPSLIPKIVLLGGIPASAHGADLSSVDTQLQSYPNLSGMHPSCIPTFLGNHSRYSSHVKSTVNTLVKAFRQQPHSVIASDHFEGNFAQGFSKAEH